MHFNALQTDVIVESFVLEHFIWFICFSIQV